MCPPLEASVLVPPQGNSHGSKAHFQALKYNSRQIGQAPTNHPDRVVLISAGVQSLSRCSRLVRPQIDLFATRFDHKLPKLLSLVQDQTAWAVDTLSLYWENLDVYAFPPVSLLNKLVSKVMDQGCHRRILIAPGWPNMSWFWDLVNLSVEIPFVLPL